MKIRAGSWDPLADARQDDRARKMSWRLLRQFQDSKGFESEFELKPNWNWKIIEQTGNMEDRAVKLQLENQSGQRCETVALFPGPLNLSAKTTRRLPRATACISSQPGCGVGCPFCSTGELGYQGNFSTAEIAEQVYWAGRLAVQAGRSLRNVVFMGMGEPLHNPNAVFGALELLTSEQHFGLSAKRLTVSTAGVPAAMRNLARKFPDVRIALSLHAAEPALRKQLVPRAVADLEVLRETIREVNHLQINHPVWLEVVLFRGINDAESHAQSLIKFCEGLRVEVNLIPYNQAAGAAVYSATNQQDRERFASLLRSAKIRTTLRNSFGKNQQAACGQLNATSRARS